MQLLRLRQLLTITNRAATVLLACLLSPPAAVFLAPSARAQVATVSATDGLSAAVAGLATGGTILFTGAGTTSIVNNILLTANPYALNIGGADQVTIRGNGSNYLFSNPSGAIDLTLSNITLTNGGAPAIYASSSVTLRLAGGDLVRIDGNHTNNSTLPAAFHGSAVSGSGNVTLTGSSASIHITNNTSSQWKRGGALYSETGILIDASTSGTFLIANNYSASTSTLDGATFTTWAGDITFSGTHANVLAVSNTSTVNGSVFRVGGSTLVIDAAVSGSFAIANNYSKWSGGAVFVNGASGVLVSITAAGAAGIRFENNTAEKLGGAIALENGGTIALDAREGDIVFTGNRHSGDYASGTASGAPLVPNAIATARNAATLDVKGDHDVLLFDPVFSRGSGVVNTIRKAGAGTLLFSGSNGWYGNTTITAGRLLVNNGALLDTGALAGTSLTLAPGAILGTYATAGSGTVKALMNNLSGILYATGASTLEILGSSTLNNITLYADVHAGNQSGRILFPNTVAFAGEGRVDLQNIAASSGTFTVFRNAAATALPAAAFSSTLYFHGYAIGAAAETSRLSGSVAVSTADPKALLAILNESPSLNVTWTGSTSNAVDFLTVNWKRDDNSAPLVTATGDRVTFDDTAVTGAVAFSGASAAAQVSAGAVMVNNSTKDYVFGGTGASRPAPPMSPAAWSPAPMSADSSSSARAGSSSKTTAPTPLQAASTGTRAPSPSPTAASSASARARR
jgi:autotransporter-associated beta strand protein/predicted outer membrane repeat protein